MANARPRNVIENEIEDMLGLVPSFFDRIPDQHLDAEWKLFRDLEFGETRIPNKYKELIGIAVHAETKCRYCTLFHTEAAKLFGATEEEIQEAAHYAKYTVGWSAYLHGTRQDYDEFAREIEKVTTYVAENAEERELVPA